MLVEDMSEEKKQYHKISGKLFKAKTWDEMEEIEKEIREFEKKHPELVDEILSRRWTAYPGDPGY